MDRFSQGSSVIVNITALGAVSPGKVTSAGVLLWPPPKKENKCKHKCDGASVSDCQFIENKQQEYVQQRHNQQHLNHENETGQMTHCLLFFNNYKKRPWLVWVSVLSAGL